MKRYVVIVCLLGGFILIAIAGPSIWKTGEVAFLLGLGGFILVAVGILIEVVGTLKKK